MTPEQTSNLGGLYAVHLLALLHEGRLSAGRFLWKRVPLSVREQPQAAAAHAALAALWRSQHAEFFKQLRAGPWDAPLQPLVEKTISRTREQLLDQLGNAYEAIALERISEISDLSASEARAVCVARNWSVDESGFAIPMRTKANEDQLQMGEQQLQKLANFVTYLEQPQCHIR